jgi:hypothetical protein
MSRAASPARPAVRPAALEDTVRRIVCRHLPKLSESLTHETVLGLFAELYKLAVETSIHQKHFAATYETAVLDAGYHLPVAALRLLEAFVECLGRADPLALVLPHRLRSYLSGVCYVLIRRLKDSAGDWDDLTEPRESDAWPWQWLLCFDYVVKQLAAEYLADSWKPPATAPGAEAL